MHPLHRRGLRTQAGDDHESLNTVESAHYLGVESYTMVKWRKNDCGPSYYKKFGKIFYKIEDLNKYKTAGITVVNPVNKTVKVIRYLTPSE